MLGRVIDGQEVQGADGEARMATAEAHRQAIGHRKFEVAMYLPHHVQQELVRRIAAVHGAANFGGGEGTNVATGVVQLAVVLLQPMLEGEAHQAAVRLVARHVGDGADPEEGVLGPWRGAAGSCLQGVLACCLELVGRRHGYPVRCVPEES